ncbi:MAG TPA: hypothetical protein VGK84_04230 [Candidatus Tumulicola sp.]
MRRALWFLNRIIAAASGAVAVGILAALILTVIDLLTCGQGCSKIFSDPSGTRCLTYASTCWSFFGTLVFNLAVVPWFSAALGLLPGILALTITPARTHPWRSLPLLVLGTLIGFVLSVALVVIFIPNRWSLVSLAMFTVLSSATGLATAYNIRSFPAMLQFGRKVV